MVKTVKLALAIMLGLVLILTQAVAVSGLGVPSGCAAQKKCCCGKDRSCCKAKPAPNSQQPPATPAQGGNSTQLQPALAAQEATLAPADAVGRTSFFSFLFTLKVTGVSLYQRNCAYLI